MSNPFFSAYNSADLFGKLIFFSLFALSILTWCIIIQTLRMQMQVSRRCKSFQRQFIASETNPLALELPPPASANPFCAVYQKLRNICLRVLEKNRAHGEEKKSFLSSTDMEFVSGQVENLVVGQTRRLGKNLFVLNMIVTLAPFLGLLGTVWGSLVTLSALRHHHSLTGNGLVLEGLSMALATTVLGLLVAIPALIGYAILRSRARKLARDTHDFSVCVLSAVEMQYRRVDP